MRANGVNVPFLLGMTLVILKVTGVIAWPWVWVLAPFWISLALLTVVMVAFIAFTAITHNK